MCSLFLFFVFLPDRPTHLHEREGDGKRNILLGWPKGIKLLINFWDYFIIFRLDNSGLDLLERFVEVSDG